MKKLQPYLVFLIVLGLSLAFQFLQPHPKRILIGGKTLPLAPELFKPWTQIRYGAALYGTLASIREVYCGRHFGIYENEGEKLTHLRFGDTPIRCVP